ncbi:MAG: phage N-6-adenine-methyltransferase [Planctomycetes bacterium]|nr:phage N-6-adenine-methyltransferase [Planctomycetota bacterium]
MGEQPNNTIFLSACSGSGAPATERGAPATERKAPALHIGPPTMSTDWRTPPEMLAPVRAYFGGRIPFDAATSPDNPTGADAFATPDDDGLARPWPAQVWVNPPYGRELRRWLGKVAHEAGRGVEVVALLPTARFETRAMQAAFAAAGAVCWVRRRVAFIRAATGERAPCPTYASMFVGWNVDPGRFARAFAGVGLVHTLRYAATWRGHAGPSGPRVDGARRVEAPPREARAPRRPAAGRPERHEPEPGLPEDEADPGARSDPHALRPIHARTTVACARCRAAIPAGGACWFRWEAPDRAAVFHDACRPAADPAAPPAASPPSGSTGAPVTPAAPRLRRGRLKAGMVFGPWVVRWRAGDQDGAAAYTCRCSCGAMDLLTMADLHRAAALGPGCPHGRRP